MTLTPILLLKFENVWVQANVNAKHKPDRKEALTDDEYIAYHQWLKENNAAMYKKYKPNTKIHIGENPNIIFHGGCLGCLSQRLHGIERCKGCIYFRFSSGRVKQNLFIPGEESAKMSAKELCEFINKQSNQSV